MWSVLEGGLSILVFDWTEIGLWGAFTCFELCSYTIHEFFDRRLKTRWRAIGRPRATVMQTQAIVQCVSSAHLVDLPWPVCVRDVPVCLSPSCQKAVRWRIWCLSSSAACGGSPGCWRHYSARWPRLPERPRSWWHKRTKKTLKSLRHISISRINFWQVSVFRLSLITFWIKKIYFW